MKRTLFFLIGAGLLAVVVLILVSKRDEAPAEGYADHGHSHGAAIPRDEGTAATLARATTPAPPAVADRLELRNPQLDPKVRVKTIRELSLGDEVSGPALELVALVISPNPIVKDSDPHSVKAYEHQREAALRVYALRRLSEELSVENFAQLVAQIESEASDATLIRIATEALKAKQRGGNYFQEMTEGIRSAPLPD